MNRQIKAGLFFGVTGLAVGYVLATAFLEFHLQREIGIDYILLNIWNLQQTDKDIFTLILVILFGAALSAAALGANFATEDLTTLGTSRWQSAWDLRRNKLIGKPGQGFLVAKTTGPRRRGQYIVYEAHPNCLVTAPTGAGKTTGFCFPNLLTFEGSTVTLDIKGENFETTARWRHKMGDKVFKFAPVEFDELSHRYNPLERIGKMKNYAQRTFETTKIAALFLQGDVADTWLKGAIQLFVAASGIAHQRGTFTLGGIYNVLASGDRDIRNYLATLAQEAREPALQRELNSLSKLDPKTLSSYQSVMQNAGFDTWANPHVAAMTSESDFSFDDLRRKRTSIYFIIKDSDLKVMAGLTRLFFNELVATIQSAMPGEDEPYKVMIILDEFHRLGKMEAIADAMTTIRAFNGRIAIITQTIPKLEAIYDKEERLSIQGGAGLKVYMTPSEEMTIEDLSTACGMTTKRVTSRSQKMGLGERTTYSERTEEKPLLSKDEARRLPADTCIVIVNAKQPVKAKRIVHYKDRKFKKILDEALQLSWDPINQDLLMRSVRRQERFETDTHSLKSVDQSVQKNISLQKTALQAPPAPTQKDYETLKGLMDRVFTLIEKDIMPLPEKKRSIASNPGAGSKSGESPNIAMNKRLRQPLSDQKSRLQL